MYFVIAAAVLVAMMLAIVRALRGPTVFDRVVAANVFGTNTVVIITVISFASGRPEFVDLALTYALISFVGTIAILKFWEKGNLAFPYVTRRSGRLDGADS